MQRSVIRGRSKASMPLRISLRSIRATKKEIKEAERRKTLFRNLRSLAGCGTRPFGTRTTSGVPPRILPEGLTHPSNQLRARLRGASTDRWRGYPARRRSRLQRAPRVPVIVSAGLIPEPPENDADEASPAGTALAPPAAVTRLASFSCERIQGSVLPQNETKVKRNRTNGDADSRARKCCWRGRAPRMTAFAARFGA